MTSPTTDEFQTPEQAETALRKALRSVLRPLVRILLRNGIAFRAFAEEAKRVFVEVADEEFLLEGRKQSIGRVAIVTGISRKEVARVRSTQEGAGEPVEGFNRAARVITAWQTDPEFCTREGEPRELDIDESPASFTELVRRSSGDMLVRAMLDELERVGAVEVKDRKVHLVSRSYIPSGNELARFRILGTDVTRLIETIDHNLEPDQATPYFQRKTWYDNLPKEALPQIRELVERHGQEFIELMDTQMRRYDRDVNPDNGGEGQFTAGIGTYYYEHETPKETDQ